MINVVNTLKFRIFVAVTVVGLLLDQVSKFLVRAYLDLHVDHVTIIPGLFDIVHAENTAAAFGALQGVGPRMLIFAVFTVIAVGVIIDLFRKLPDTDRFMSFTLGLIFSGALGNAFDRIHKQSVTDFLRVYTDNPTARAWLIEKVGTNEWPSFNIADSALVVGVILFGVHYLFAEEEAAPAATDATKAADGTKPPEQQKA